MQSRAAGNGVRRGRTALGVLALSAVAVVALIGFGSAMGLWADDAPEVSLEGVPADRDPYPYEAARRAEFEARAASGSAHVVFANSPEGALATAERVARFRDQIEAATAGSGTDPDLLEAIVFLESAGRPEVIAGKDPELASGLVQIVASTGTALLDMRVDLERSRKLTVQARRALRRGGSAPGGRVLGGRGPGGQRFDPPT